MPECTHETISRDAVPGTGGGNLADAWSCDGCSIVFAPVMSLAAEVARIEAESDKMLDMVTAVFSASLWDLHERAFNAHGVPHPHDDPVVAATLCEQTGHDYEGTPDGSCKNCGHSPFLGGK